MTWHFAVRIFATVIQKETLKSSKLSTLEESEIEAYRIPELGEDECNIAIVHIFVLLIRLS